MELNIVRPKALILILFIVFVQLAFSNEIKVLAKNKKSEKPKIQEFPPHFKFGSATSAYQIEGAWNIDGKTPSIWDDLVHDHLDLVQDQTTSDIGTDSYHFFENDIRILKETGLNVYRFSISWTRILPDGFTPNPVGIQHYGRLIDRLLAEGIEPLVTLYHFDLPRYLQKLGGWTNPIVQDYFRVYADVVFAAFGDRVKRWITVNEPFLFCIFGYGQGNFAPLINGFEVGAEYLCADNVLKSHAEVYHLYRDKYHSRFGGKIGISVCSHFFYPAHPIGNSSDDRLDDRAVQFMLGWFTHSIFSKSGYYPPVMVETIRTNSLREGRPWSRLPQWSEELRKRIQGSADFLGINYYTSRLVEEADPKNIPKEWGNGASFFKDTNIIESIHSSWVQANSSGQYSVPSGIGDLVRWIRDEYDNPEVVITENGWSNDGDFNDIDRINYLRDHLREILRAVVDDGCNITGYTVWTLFDNFEWCSGFTKKFGMHSVDLMSANKTRTAKLSASYFRRVIETRRIPEQ